MSKEISGFDWDSGNRSKCLKHGVSITEIEALFYNPILIIPDTAHSQTEDRMRGIGKTQDGRSIFLVFTIRNAGKKNLSGQSAQDTCIRRRLIPMKKKIPAFKTDAEAERFVAQADLTKYDLSGLKPVQFEFEKKNAQLNMRLPKPLLNAVKLQAKHRGIPYTRFIREALENSLLR